MIDGGHIEHEPNIGTVILLHRINEITKCCLVMRTLCSAHVACLLFGRKDKMQIQYTAFPALLAELSKIGEQTVGVGFLEVVVAYLVNES